jgi:hypothetical protein
MQSRSVTVVFTVCPNSWDTGAMAATNHVKKSKFVTSAELDKDYERLF